jgi:pentatricopeptide repeat protein
MPCTRAHGTVLREVLQTYATYASKQSRPKSPKKSLASFSICGLQAEWISMKARRQNPAQDAQRDALKRILLCKKERKWQDAIAILSKARMEGAPLSTVSYNAAIDCCSKSKQVRVALELFDELVCVGNFPDAVTYTTLIDACGRAGHLDQAFALFSR